MYPSTSIEIRTTASLLLIVGAVALLPDVVTGIMCWCVGERTQNGLGIVIPVMALLVVSAWSVHRWKIPNTMFGLPVISLGLALSWILNVVTTDGSVGALVGPMLPLTYAAYHLRQRYAVMVVVMVMISQVQTSLAYGDSGRSARDVFILLLIEAAISWFIIRSRLHQHELQAELVRRAEVDALTGLATRRVVDEALTAAFDTPGPSVAMLVFDLDGFKTINDNYGHPVGDLALTTVADRLRSVLRPGDVAGRFGGDEFAVLMRGCSPREALGRAREIVQAIQRDDLVTPGGAIIPLSISAGVAHSEDATDVESLYQSADRSMYEAKRANRSHIGMN